MIEVIANDRLGRKVRVKCSPDDTVGDLKKLIAAQTGTAPQKVLCNSHADYSKEMVHYVQGPYHAG